ncbi:MAG: hypothetical protein HKN87_09020 [Saprospiraceae bacterium]|nr:hypothetical protein [Saprospiraceae bacterium]
MIMMCYVARIFGILLFLACGPCVMAGNPVIPGNLESYSTIHSIGFEWDITGDDNHNATCSLQYKVAGAATYISFKSMYRVDFEGYNMLAGSILFLDPGTTYDVRLTMVDPDGGNSTQNIQVTTRAVPRMPTNGQTYHVISGNGGGTGSAADPFQGVDAAEAFVVAGDVCLLHAGNYGNTVRFNTGGTENNPIVWKAAGDGDPVFEGVRVEASYVWFEGIRVIDQQYGMRTSPPAPKDIVVTRCNFYNNHYGIYLNDGGEGWYIADNVIVGDNIPKTSNFSGEGIELWYTDGHTVAHNTISRVADGISYPGKNVDMFGNDIFDTSDDGIEFDYGHANNRAWGNRITNLFNNGISFQPMNGAPYYVLFNQVSVLNGQSVLKLRTRSDRALIAHNTFIINSGPMASGSEFLNNFEIKNNLWISIQDRYAWENGATTSSNWKTDFDYDGFDWGNYTYAFKWSNVRLNTIADFTAQTGQEVHGIEIDYDVCFEHLNYTSSGNAVDSFHIEYNTLVPNCDAVDAGIVITGINENHMGSHPDLGAYEVGKSLPMYGVRSTCTNISVNTWMGPAVGFWHADATNWSLGHIPTSCDQVVIGTGNHIQVASGETAEGYSIDIATGATFETQGDATIILIAGTLP